MSNTLPKETFDKMRFHDRPDPADPSYRLIEIRIPSLPGVSYDEIEHVGFDAGYSLRRMCAMFLCGTGDITEEHGRLIRDDCVEALGAKS